MKPVQGFMLGRWQRVRLFVLTMNFLYVNTSAYFIRLKVLASTRIGLLREMGIC